MLTKLSEVLGGHPDLPISNFLILFSLKSDLQLRDSDGFTPYFPRYLQRLIPFETKSTFTVAQFDDSDRQLLIKVSNPSNRMRNVFYLA